MHIPVPSRLLLFITIEGAFFIPRNAIHNGPNGTIKTFHGWSENQNQASKESWLCASLLARHGTDQVIYLVEWPACN